VVVVAVVFIHNVPVQLINQLKADGLSRSHPEHVATAAVTHQQEKRERKKYGGKLKRAGKMGVQLWVEQAVAAGLLEDGHLPCQRDRPGRGDRQPVDRGIRAGAATEHLQAAMACWVCRRGTNTNAQQRGRGRRIG